VEEEAVPEVMEETVEAEIPSLFFDQFSLAAFSATIF